MAPSTARGGPGGSSRGRSLLFGGLALVCFVLYSTLSASYHASEAPPAYRPNSIPAWSTVGKTTYEAQANSVGGAVGGGVGRGGSDGGHEVLLEMIRDFLSRSSADEVGALKHRLQGILGDSSATKEETASASDHQPGAVEGGKKSATKNLRQPPVPASGTGNVASKWWQRKPLSSTGAKEESAATKGETEVERVAQQGEEGSEEGGERLVVEGGKGEAKGNGGGMDLLWWADTKHRAKTAVEEEAERDEEYATKCRNWKSHYQVVPGASWGDLPFQLQEEWKSVNCDEYLVEVKEIVPSSDCTSAVEVPFEDLPLIAIMAAATTRNVKNIKLKKLALFRHLMPSIVRTVECGFRYLMVVGYDLGDSFYDSKNGQRQIHKWFKETIQSELEPVRIKIDLLLVPVDNKLQKPGPVFLEMARAAYREGAEYYYRVNDDTECLNPWPTTFVAALKSMGFPYGAVGPLCRQGNTKILTHDFTHRTHMEIFEGEYYPPQLTDWWMDDWIARTYGSTRTRQSKSIEVIHHTGAHGQRYNVDPTHQTLLDGLVSKGRQKIIAYMTDQEVAPEEIDRFKNSRFDKFPLQDIGLTAVSR